MNCGHPSRPLKCVVRGGVSVGWRVNTRALCQNRQLGELVTQPISGPGDLRRASQCRSRTTDRITRPTRTPAFSHARVGYRFYEPNLQRWLNRDPIGERGGIHLYRFNRNDPVDSLDPFGMADRMPAWCDILTAGAAALACEPLLEIPGFGRGLYTACVAAALRLWFDPPPPPYPPAPGSYPLIFPVRPYPQPPYYPSLPPHDGNPVPAPPPYPILFPIRR